MEPLTPPGAATVEEKEPPSCESGKERSYGQTGEEEGPLKRTSIQANDSEIRRKRERARLAARRGRVYAAQQEHSEDAEGAPRPVPAESHSLTHGSFMEEEEGSEKSQTGSQAHSLLAVEPNNPVLPQEPPSSAPADQPVDHKVEAPQPSNGNGEESHQFRRRNATHSGRRGLHRHPDFPTPNPQHHGGEVEQTTAGAPPQSLGQASM